MLSRSVYDPLVAERAPGNPRPPRGVGRGDPARRTGLRGRRAGTRDGARGPAGRPPRRAGEPGCERDAQRDRARGPSRGGGPGGDRPGNPDGRGSRLGRAGHLAGDPDRRRTLHRAPLPAGARPRPRRRRVHRPPARGTPHLRPIAASDAHGQRGGHPALPAARVSDRPPDRERAAAPRPLADPAGAGPLLDLAAGADHRLDRAAPDPRGGQQPAGRPRDRRRRRADRDDLQHDRHAGRDDPRAAAVHGAAAPIR